MSYIDFTHCRKKELAPETLLEKGSVTDFEAELTRRTEIMSGSLQTPDCLKMKPAENIGVESYE